MEPLVVAPKAEVAVEAVEPKREERRDDRRGDRRDRSEPRSNDTRPESRPDARSETRNEGRGEYRGDRREPRDDRRDYRRDRDLGPSVVGMGDHVPDFILRSFALKASPVEEVEDSTGTEV
jgi:hypothetical protein